MSEETTVENTEPTPKGKGRSNESRNGHRYRGGNIRSKSYKKAKALDLAAKGLPVSDIAKAVELPRSTVSDLIKKFSPIFKKLPDVRQYRDIKADILAASQLAALESAFSGNKLAKASFTSTLNGFEILNKAERLDRGESTENVASKFTGTLSIGALLDENE